MTAPKGEAFTLYTYYRSSAAYRVRIGLNLKNIRFESKFINLAEREQFSESYRNLNPAAAIPLLITEAGPIAESMAILEYLDTIQPEPPFLPENPYDQALVRSFAFHIASNLHPLNNLSVLTYLRKNVGLDDEGVLSWYRHWIADRLRPLEANAARHQKRGPFMLGDRPTLADICLVPQLYNARRFECPLEEFPRLLEVDGHCRSLKPFRDAAPENQPDAP